MRVFLVGQIRATGPWEVQGVFNAEEKAVAACATRAFFVMPLEMDKIVTTDTIQNAGAYFPLIMADV